VKIKLAFATATAVGLLMGIDAAAAAGNVSSIYQSGTDNHASISQDDAANDPVWGGGNYAGNPTWGVNYVWYTMQQLGNHNNLTVDQTGSQNSIAQGLSSPDSPNVRQHGNSNRATITEQSGVQYEGNALGSLYQMNNGNQATLTQKSVGAAPSDGVQNAIQEVYQNGADEISVIQLLNPTAGPTFHKGNLVGLVKQSTTNNTGNIKQTGTQNLILSVTQQVGSSNDVTIEQNGRGNRLDSLAQSGSGNVATVKLLGNYNGANSGTTFDHLGQYSPFGHGFAVGGFAAGAAGGVGGITASVVTQTGNNDYLSYTASGNSNAFGFAQLTGSGNTISGVSDDDANQVAIYQDGSNNWTTFSQYDGSNDLGVHIVGNNNGVNSFVGAAIVGGVSNGNITQTGGLNYASVTISGSSDNYGATQNGGSNTLTLSMIGGNQNNVAVKQAGGDTAIIMIDGGKNVIGAQQIGAGTNLLTVNLFGDSNNWTGSLSGEAAVTGLTAGSIVQNNNGGGGLNKISLDVGTSTADSNSNLFAFKQQGSGNVITGSISGGNSNQVAVAQIGNTNTFSFAQVGSNNNIGAKQ
jgi:hypothetical protein